MANLSLIRSWHEKAKEDYFSSYIFEYLAFEAFLKKFKYSESEIRQAAGNKKERSYIQHFKNEPNYNKVWVQLLSENEELLRNTESLRDYLQMEPLLANNWWACSAYTYANCSVPANLGMISDVNNLGEIIEFWYYVRNNLFHATKDPNDERDERLVTYAYQTLSVFMEKVLIPEMEQRIMVPAQWEDFSYKFFKGQAEAQVRLNGVTACANVYELLYVEERYLPVLFDGHMIDRQYVIDKLSMNLLNLVGDDTLCKNEWEAIISRASSDEQREQVREYFSDTINAIKQMIPDFAD